MTVAARLATRYTSPFRMLLDLRGIQKRFGGVQALSEGNLQIRAGEAHLLLGENGAGKSTLMKIVAGGQPPGAPPARSGAQGGRATRATRTSRGQGRWWR